MLKNILKVTLKKLASLIIWRQHPEIIGVTGSVGKTSSKEMIHTVLSRKFRVRQNIKNYNNEIGLPLTIIGVVSPEKNILGWLIVFIKAIFLIIIRNKNYPEILVLEMGVDHPGDMNYLKEIAQPTIGVITLIGLAHLEFFETQDNIKKEKAGIVSDLPKNGWAILNFDDEKTNSISKITSGKVLTFGLDKDADVRASEINIIFEPENKRYGLNFKLHYQGSAVPVLLPNLVSEASVYAALIGASLGFVFGLNAVEIASAFQEIKATSGRMQLLPGINNSLIINDAYNASPTSMVMAINTLVKLPLHDKRRLLVLGDMLEIGDTSIEEHRKIGKLVAQEKIDLLVTYGDLASYIAQSAIDNGFDKKQVRVFNNKRELVNWIKQNIAQNDTVLVKGSNGMKLNELILEIVLQ